MVYMVRDCKSGSYIGYTKCVKRAKRICRENKQYEYVLLDRIKNKEER